MIGLLPTAVVFTVAYFSPPPITFTAFYLLITAAVTWAGGIWPGLFIGLVSAGALYLDERWDMPGTAAHWALYLNLAIRTGMFSFTPWLVARLKRFTEELESKVRQRTAELEANVAALKQTEAELRDIVQRFQEVTDNITEGFWLTEPKSSKVL
jgi:hypothetical protein